MDGVPPSLLGLLSGQMHRSTGSFQGKDINIGSENMPRTGLTLESDENKLVAMGIDAAKKLLEDGKASPSLILYLVKQGSVREKLEREMLATQKELLKAKKEAIESQTRIEELYNQAMQLMKTYSGEDDGTDELPSPY